MDENGLLRIFSLGNNATYDAAFYFYIIISVKSSVHAYWASMTFDSGTRVYGE